LRDRQRDYYYHKLDRLFPGLRGKYEQTYGDQYHCQVTNAATLENVFRELCDKYSISTSIPTFSPPTGVQLSLI
jgi:hypothetical protein